MPVKIQIEDNSTDPRVISLQSYLDGRANFSLHYYYTDQEAAFGGGEVAVPWDDLQAAVENYKSATGMQDDDIALRFVHCFDDTAHELFLRLQICQMVASTTPPPPGAEMVFDLVVTNSQWYEIKNGLFAPANVTTLASPMYLNNFYYKEEPQAAEMQRLSEDPTKYVKNLVLPWGFEINMMYQENGSPANATVHFAACSYETPGPYSNVLWPHGMVVFLSDAEGPMLDNEDTIVVFHNKGADAATLCPPECSKYIQPIV